MAFGNIKRIFYNGIRLQKMQIFGRFGKKRNNSTRTKGCKMRITENDLFDKEVQAIHFDRFNKKLCIYIPKLNCWCPITMLVNSFLKHEQPEQKDK